MTQAFAYFEMLPTGSKVRAIRDHTFATIEAALAHFGDKVVEFEVSEDGGACDLFVNVGGSGMVYAIERVG